MSRESFVFTEEQLQIIDGNTLAAITSGLAGRHSQVLREEISRHKRLLELPDQIDVIERMQKISLDFMSEAYSSEDPFRFRLEPSNMARAVIIERVRRRTGLWIFMSQAQIGLVDGLAAEGQPSDPFTQEDLAFALQAIQSQEIAGLNFNS